MKKGIWKVNKMGNDEIIFSDILVTGDDDFLVLAIDRLLCGIINP